MFCTAGLRLIKTQSVTDEAVLGSGIIEFHLDPGPVVLIIVADLVFRVRNLVVHI